MPSNLLLKEPYAPLYKALVRAGSDDKLARQLARHPSITRQAAHRINWSRGELVSVLRAVLESGPVVTQSSSYQYRRASKHSLLPEGFALLTAMGLLKRDLPIDDDVAQRSDRDRNVGGLPGADPDLTELVVAPRLHAGGAILTLSTCAPWEAWLMAA